MEKIDRNLLDEVCGQLECIYEAIEKIRMDAERGIGNELLVPSLALRCVIDEYMNSSKYN